MSETSPTPKKTKWQNIWHHLAQKNMMISLLMGFSSGMPFLLTSRTLQLWLSFKGGSNALVGYVSLIGLPYALKFLWAPLLDRYKISALGRRRGWLLVTQIALLAGIWALSFLDPLADIKLAASLAIFIAFASASQDIVTDAYRREVLTDEEIGLGASFYNMGYRIAMWVTGGFAVILASYISWNTVYQIVSVGILIGLGTTLWADEPKEGSHTPRTLEKAVVLPLKDFFQRDQAIATLLFIILFKAGDAMAANMFSKLYVTLGFSPAEIGTIAKSLTPFSVTIGGFLGGAIILRFGIIRSLFAFGVFQALSTSSYALLDMAGHNLYVMGGVVFLEDFATGMNSTALIAYLSSLTNRNFTATQYALFASLASIPRTVLSSVTGHIVDAIGFAGFFVFCAFMALPGLMLLYYLHTKSQKTA